MSRLFFSRTQQGFAVLVFKYYFPLGLPSDFSTFHAYTLIVETFSWKSFFSLGQVGSLQFPIKLSPHSIPHTPEESNTPSPSLDALSSAFARHDLLGFLCLSAHNLTALQDSLHVTDCSFAPIHLIGFTRPSDGLSPRSGPGNFFPKLRSAIRLLGFYRYETSTR